MKNKTLFVLLIFATSIFFSSCWVEKKRVATIDSQLEKLIEINQGRIAKGEQSEEIGSKVNSTLSDMQARIKRDFEEARRSPRSIQLRKRLNNKIRVYQAAIETFIRLYELESFKSFESKNFFSSGQYVLRSRQQKKVLEEIIPLIDEIVREVESNPQKAIKFKVVLGVYGYTDEEGIGKSGPLYETLKEKTDQNNPSQKELNQKLSELRAKSLAELINKSLVDRGLKNQEAKIQYEINWLGRGYSAVPRPNIDYTAKDERRRVVNVIWGVIPILTDDAF